MIKGGLSAVTVTKHLHFLNMITKDAVNKHQLVWNPCAAVKPPKQSKVNPSSLDVDTVQRLFKRLNESEPTSLITSAAIALFTGMREGEICALRWENVEFENHTINVASAIGTGAGGSYIKTPKNESSMRLIPIPPQLMDMLKRRRTAQYAEWLDYRMKLELPKTDEAFNTLFVTGSIDGSHATPAIISRAWKEFADNNGIVDTKGNRAVFHTLRHTYASLLIAQGYEDVTVASLLGHARPSMTKDVYSAAFKAREKAAAESVGKTIGSAITDPKLAEVIRLDRTGTDE